MIRGSVSGDHFLLGPPGKMTSEHRTEMSAVCGTLLYSQHDEWCQLYMWGWGVVSGTPFGIKKSLYINLNTVLIPFSKERN